DRALQGPRSEQRFLRLFARGVVGADQQVADDDVLRIAQRRDRDDGGEAAAVLADVGQFIDVLDPARGLEHQRLEAGRDGGSELDAQGFGASDHFLRVGNIGRRYLVHHFGGRIAQHSFGADVEDLNHTFFIGGDAREIRAVENSVLQSPGLEQCLAPPKFHAAVRVGLLFASAPAHAGFPHRLSHLSSSTREKRLPLPASLSNSMCPPISAASFCDRCSPSPVPWWRRVPDARSCSNAWNSFPWSSAGMPMPVSSTLKRVRSRPLSRFCASSILTTPRSVNLIALLVRLSRIWVSARRSVLTMISPFCAASSNFSPLASPSGRNPALTSSRTLRHATGSGCSSTLPDSIFARSSRSLISDSRCLELDWIVVSCFACSGLSGPGSFISIVPVKPMIAFSGVRSSCDMLARKRSFAWLAPSSSTFFSCSVCS